MLKPIKRTSAKDKRIMQKIVDDCNHDAKIDKTDECYIPEYRIEKLKNSWVMTEYVLSVHLECVEFYTVGDRVTCAGFIRCSFCGDIDYRWDDECPECVTCYDTGTIQDGTPITRL